MFILAIILFVLALIAFATAPKMAFTDGREKVDGRRPTRIVGTILLLLGLGATAMTTLYQQDPGTARVVINWGGTVDSVDVTPGWGFKAPWQRTVEYDLLSQLATFAGSDQGAPSYADGNIQGREITVSLGRIQSNVDAQITYSLEADRGLLERIYTRYRTQENFTRQVITPALLATVREVPSQVRATAPEDPDGEGIEQTPGVLTPVQFRGEYRAEVASRIESELNEALAEFGVVIENVELQDVRYPANVEEGLRAVEAAQLREEEAEANLRATEIEAQAQVVQAEQAAEAAIAEAQGQAEANRLLSESLTPQVLQQRYIEALKAGTVYVVPEGSTPLVTTN